jgi:threonine aldolase
LPLPNKPDGTFDLEKMEERVRDTSDDHEPVTSLICVENTQNWCGGKVLPLEWLDDVSIAGNYFLNIYEIFIIIFI